MPSTKKAKTAARTTTKKQAKPKAAKKAKAASTPIDWSNAIAKAAEQKRTQATWPGSGDSWKKKVRI